MSKEKDKKKNVHKLTFWIYEHFFHFFDIPEFLPKKLIEKFFKHWNKYFFSRDYLKNLIDNKDYDIEEINIQSILDIIGNIITEQDETKVSIDLIIAENKDKMNDLESSGNSFQTMLNGIIDLQNNYSWKTS